MSPPFFVDVYVYARCFVLYWTPKSWFSSDYSGNPQDYQDRFVKVVDIYSNDWPRSSQAWARNVFQKSSGSFEEGLKEITTTLVEDMGDFQGTKGFADKDQKEIIDYLLVNEKYLQTAHKEWDDLVGTPAATAAAAEEETKK